jgi:hypothetical protein
LINHQLLIRLPTTRSQNWRRRAHLTHGFLAESPT